jgi:hypothetical protein
VDRTSGPDAWSQIMKRTADSGWNPFALSRAMKQETGRSAATNYQDTSELGELWNTRRKPGIQPAPYPQYRAQTGGHGLL